jgi:hypothetical protein
MDDVLFGKKKPAADTGTETFRVLVMLELVFELGLAVLVELTQVR